MQMTELIAKKRDGGILSGEEIAFMIRGYVDGTIPDYQMSAMCMAILFQGMDERETLDLSPIRGVKADKHSTGGVGDKTSLVLCPMVAACGVKIAKMSGRGLGHTGGTIDKLESFPGFVTGISEERFFENVNRIGIAIAGQTAEVCPADKKLYALRDVTGTVPSIPLIVSSIMSKKLAAGADVIVLDVKCGSGAFMKTVDQARELAAGLTRVGNLAGRRCAAVITDMDEPLGFAVGNALEVKEAIDVLAGRTEAGELLPLCLTLGECILTGAGLAESGEQAREKLRATIADGSALRKLAEMVEAQFGDSRAVYDPSLLPAAKLSLEVPADGDGYVAHIEAEDVGLVSMHLGGGRATKESEIDLSVGVVLHKKVGDRVGKGGSLATIYASDEKKAEEAAALLKKCYSFSDTPVVKEPFIKDIIR